MPLIYDNSYENIRNRVHPGDVIAFSGDAPISTVIKLGTSSHVSHVGMIAPGDDSAEGPLIAEATEDGIRTRTLRERYEDNDVEKLWWLPLDPVFRTRLTKKLWRGTRPRPTLVLLNSASAKHGFSLDHINDSSDRNPLSVPEMMGRGHPYPLSNSHFQEFHSGFRRLN